MYLELIRSYTYLMHVKQEEFLAAKVRYLGGLDKLMFAAEQVRHFVSAVIRMWFC